MELSPHPAHDDLVAALRRLGIGHDEDLVAAGIIAELEMRGFRISDGPPQPAWDLLKQIVAMGMPELSPPVQAHLDGLHRSIREDLIAKGIDPGDPLVLCALVHGAVTATAINEHFGSSHLGPNAVKSYVIERMKNQWM